MPPDFVPRQSIINVASTEQLNALCQQWKQCSLLAVDSEFMRTKTYFPVPALLQFNDGKASYLIDPLELNDLSPLKTILCDENITKTFHAGAEDLEVFGGMFDTELRSVFDTQLAAAILGHGFSLGYANLVAKLFDVELPKAETRSDWLQRPLTSAQKNYAALDVELLFPLAEQLLQELQSSGRMPWYIQEQEQFLLGLREQQALDYNFKKFKSAWKFQPRELEIIRQLYIWRDREARNCNRPKNRVLKEATIIQLAEIKPHHISQLRTVPDMGERSIRRYGEQLLDVIEQSVNTEENKLPEVPDRPLNGKQKQNTRVFREAINGLAESLQIAPEILLKKNHYEALARSCKSLPLNEACIQQCIEGWRYELVRETLIGIQPEVV